MPVVVVTGASRGIGRAAAIALAEAGFDVVLSARTLREGRGRDDGDFARGGRAIAGSLEDTAAAVEAAGARALPVVCDLLDRDAVEGLVTTTLDAFGRDDVLVNNAIYHRGNNQLLAELTPEAIEDNLRANVVHPLVLVTRVLPLMIEQGGGRIVNVVSGAGERDPARPALQGGWGVLYGMNKAALQRVAGVVAVEAGDGGVLCFSLNPGFVKTAVVGALPGFDQAGGDVEEDVPAAAIRILATSPDVAHLNGQTVTATSLLAGADTA